MNQASQPRVAAIDVGISARRTRTRFGILALLAVGTMINYLDRSVAGIAAPSMSHELGLNPALMGVIFSAFSWTYTAAQIPGGVMLDRVGTRWTYFFALTFWSLFTGLQGLATGFVSLLIMRLLIGVAEAPCFPTNSRVVAVWFPQSERARATGIYTFAEYVGLAFLSPRSQRAMRDGLRRRSRCRAPRREPRGFVRTGWPIWLARRSGIHALASCRHVATGTLDGRACRQSEPRDSRRCTASRALGRQP
jgi:hypothetical protein